MKKDAVRVSLRQKEFENQLGNINTKRTLLVSIALAIAIPLVYLAARIFNIGLQGNRMLAGIIAAEVIQLVFAGVSYYMIRHREMDKMFWVYRLHMALTVTLVQIVGVMELTETGSNIFFVAAMTLFAVVPVFTKTEQKFASILLAVTGIVSAACVFSVSIRYCLDIVVLTAGAVLLNRYNSDFRRRHERMSDELKQKTISSEQDPLTGMTNRRGLSKRANVLWPYCARAKSRVGIIAIDIDFFKKYNDKYGHPEGDKCLIKIADAIKGSARRGTDIAARIGGEEFLVFVQAMTNEEVVGLALKIRNRVSELQIPHAYVGVSPYVTVSMGIATVQPDGMNNFHQLYEEADQALYTAKSNGRNCIVCDGLLYGRMKNGLGTVING